MRVCSFYGVSQDYYYFQLLIKLPVYVFDIPYSGGVCEEVRRRGLSYYLIAAGGLEEGYIVFELVNDVVGTGARIIRGLSA